MCSWLSANSFLIVANQSLSSDRDTGRRGDQALGIPDCDGELVPGRQRAHAILLDVGDELDPASIPPAILHSGRRSNWSGAVINLANRFTRHGATGGIWVFHVSTSAK